ncbi:chemotaxis protein [bacterium]|nr:chemotaxis protein [bacterium]
MEAKSNGASKADKPGLATATSRVQSAHLRRRDRCALRVTYLDRQESPVAQPKHDVMKNWTIGKRITIGFSLLLTLSAITGGVTWYQLHQIQDHSVFIRDEAIPGLEMSGKILDHAMRYRVIGLKHVMAESEEKMQALDKAADAEAQKLLELLKQYDAKVTNEQDRKNFAKLERLLNAYRDEAKKIRALSLQKQNTEAIALMNGAGADAWNEFEGALTAVRDWNHEAGDRSIVEISKTVDRSRVANSVMVVTGVFTGIGFSVLIVRGIRKVLSRVAEMLSDGANQVAAAAGQVSASSQSLAEGASEQAASLEETSSSLEEMSSMTRGNSETADKANDLANQTRTAAEKGAADMRDMSTAMEAIKISSDDIAKIIKNIDEIAFQTNILALNAAVEAARAGDAGMGFAVVADEVRNLAQRSARASKETAAKIEGAISKTAQGVEISHRVATALGDIVSKARQVDELAASVVNASREQSQGIGQINLAVGQMDKVTQSNAANAEESAAAAEELSAQAETMKHSVSELMHLVDGRANRHSNVPQKTPKAVDAKKHLIVPHESNPSHKNGNGRTRNAEPVSSQPTIRRSELPLAGDFTEF